MQNEGKTIQELARVNEAQAREIAELRARLAEADYAAAEAAEETYELRARMIEAEEALAAIRNGEVDALLISRPDEGDRVYTLEGADSAYRLLVENMQEGALTMHEDGSIFFSNQRFADMVGQPLEKVLGTTFDRFVHPDDQDIYQELRQASQRKRVVGEIRIMADDGSFIPAYLSLHILQLQGTQSTCMLVLNLSVQKRNEQLAAADRRKDEFLAMLAHELRNPLAPIRYAAQVLHMDGLTPEQIKKQHEVIDRQVSHMGRLLDDLLEVSRITRGKIQLKREIVDLRAVATQALDSMRPMIEGRGQHLLYEGPSSPMAVDGDPTRLEQIIRNLLHNANKFCEAGGCIKLSLGLETEHVWRAVVRVVDSGIGIEPEMLPRIFELFSQAEQSLDRTQGGLGIGLAMVKNLVQMHGGSVEAQSAGLGQGSEFVVRLPLAAAALGELRGVPALEDESQGARVEPRRVLVVDDNEDAAASLGELLSLWGHEVQTAHDGKHALEAAREWQPEIILLDIGLPEMDGYEVARHLREEPATAGTYLVALTGYGQEEDRRRAHEAGFNQHLTKPVELESLQQVLNGLRAA